jgi:DNA repair exonuclease SbcCD nuclease subunit
MAYNFIMNNYFKKAVVFGDSHFGRSSDSIIANQDNLDFITWMIDRARSWGAETCIFLGDLFHNRSAIGLNSLQAGLQSLEQLSSAGFEKIALLVGNHDIARRQSREVCSLNFGRHIPKIALINHPLIIDNVILLPWLLENELLPIQKSRYLFAHLETIGAMMNARVMCTGGQHAIDIESLADHEHVFSGHFHQRQTLKNITYIGSIMPFDFSDANDDQRGAMFLEWGRDPIFEAWPEQPLYCTATLSELLSNLKLLKTNMTVRATVDIDLRYEEAQEMRDMLISRYALRKIELLNVEPVEPEYNELLGSLHTVDQIVIDGLNSIESTLSNDRLISIFNALPRHY